MNNKTQQKADKQRLGLYAKIEIGRLQLPEMDDDKYFYGTFLTDNFGTPDKPIESKKDLSLVQLIRCVDIMARMGAVFSSKGSNKQTKPHVRPDWMNIPDGTAYAAEKREICAIWRKLGYSMTSLQTRVKRQCGKPSLLWVDDGKKISILLTDLQKRERSFDKKRATSEGNS